MSVEPSSSSLDSVALKKRSTIPRSISELVTNQLVPGTMAKSQALQHNMDVDYVVVYRFPPAGIYLINNDPPTGRASKLIESRESKRGRWIREVVRKASFGWPGH